jgi:hypothetical protein
MTSKYDDWKADTDEQHIMFAILCELERIADALEQKQEASDD